MELKEGYKQTEVGVIPEDWEVKPLLEGLSETPAYGINAPAQTYKKGLPAYIRITDITDEGTYNPPKQTYADVSDEEQYFLKQGDIVFARTGASVGKSYLYHKSDGELVYAGFLIKVHPDSITFYPEYVFYFAHSDQYWNWVAKTSMRSGQPGINGVEYGELLLPCPRINEQKAIASVLSDVDALLSSLNALIAKKRDIKKAAMQELLTGKTRLPGFSGKWVEKRICDVAELNPESLPSSTSPDYAFKYIALEDVSRGNLLQHSKQIFSGSPSRARRVISKGDILVATVRPNLKSHLLVKFQDKNWICSTGFCVVRCHAKEALPSYIYYHFFEEIINNQIDLLITGSNYPAINSTDVEELRIPLPPDIAEQAAIAAVLSDMDAEIAALEARRAKMQDIKTGMMQELLTGKTRLLPQGKQHG